MQIDSIFVFVSFGLTFHFVFVLFFEIALFRHCSKKINFRFLRFIDILFG